jgi:hypothetical protein
MVSRPAWADSGLRWFEEFDRVDIAAIQRQAKLGRDVVPQRFGVTSALFRELHSAFVPPKPAKQSKKARLAAEKASATAARIAGIERKIEMGRQMVALRDKTPCNKMFGRLRSKYYDVDTVAACELMRVARLYGARPEIYRTVAW